MTARRSLLAILFVAASVPIPAQAQEVSVRLEALGGASVPQGMPFRYRVIVDNPTASAVSLDLSFDLVRVEGDDPPVPYDRWASSVGAGSTATFERSVVPSQWFVPLGKYRVVARKDVAVARLGFEVTRAPVRVPRFRDVTEEVGLATEHAGVSTCGQYSAGAAWADVDQDRDLDLYLPHQDAPAQLWINEGGHFEERAAQAGVDNAGSIGIAAVFADYDNDGDQDLFVVNDGLSRLYRSDGGGAFTDVTQSSGLTLDLPGSSASWGDYDGDGFLDLYVPTWGRCEPSQKYYRDVLYHNEGDGTFTDQTALLESTGSTMGAGFEAAWWDYDLDGDQDLYLGNDYVGSSPKPNVLWRNDGPAVDGTWRFTNVSVESGTGISINTMGIGIGDYDRDLDFDMALSNIESSVLFRNDGDGTFTDVADWARVARPTQRVRQRSITWGLAFHDLNLDGWEDLYVAAGMIVRHEPQSDAVFVNGRDGRFLDLSAPSRADDPGTGRGAAFADYDRDGRMDFYVVNIDEEPHLYRNVTSLRGMHWLEVDTIGSRSNRDGCGARLTLVVDRATRMLRNVFCGSVSLGAGSDPTVHFGLGRADRVGSLIVEWPSGVRQVVRDVRIDRLIRVREPAG